MELQIIAWLREHLPEHPCLRLGIGDDAALLRLGSGSECVTTVDLLCDGVDFLLDQIDPRQAGRKALAVSLSDLAAMAAQPMAALVALLLPRRGGLRLAQQLYEGMLPLAQRYAVAIAGGDTNSWDGPLVVSVTALGTLCGNAPLRRSGAMAGDVLVVSGALGGSIVGHHLDFTPRVAEALYLARHYELHAGIDISDGLALDLSRMVSASGCGAVVDVDLVPISDDARRLADHQADRREPLEHALYDGEDFELLLAVPPATAVRLLAQQPLPVPVTRIGEVIDRPGLWQRSAGAALRPLPPRGYEH